MFTLVAVMLFKAQGIVLFIFYHLHLALAQLITCPGVIPRGTTKGTHFPELHRLISQQTH